MPIVVAPTGPQVSKRVRDAAQARLIQAWPAVIRGAGEAYSQVPPAEVDEIANIDWSGRARRQVYLSNIDIATLTEKESALVYPIATLSTDLVSATGEEKWKKFSGTVSLQIQFAYRWRNISAQPAFEQAIDLIEDGILQCFHDQRWAGAPGSGVTYHGAFNQGRSPIGADKNSNWLQIVIFRLEFGVDV